MRILLSAALLLQASACGVEQPRECVEDRCETEGSKAELLTALDGYNDPVARFLRASVTEQGTLAGDYQLVLDGVGTELGCDSSTENSYVVLSNQGYQPKPILTRCSDNALDASQFFAAMVTKGDGTGIDAKQMHLASWDADAGLYRRYATAETPGGEMAVNVAPDFCLGCHAGPQKLGTWMPLMNEMSSPWANWNAHPGFVSLEFDEFLDPTYSDDPTYRELTRDDRLESAAAFEPIVRAGIQRATGARLKTRSQQADVTAALELVRPLFCDESTNYVSEVHGSGELRIHALVDDSIRHLFRTADIAGPWSWLADTRIQLPAPQGTEQPVTLIPVRGEATLQIELGLVARGVLTAQDALRVRALDWKHPVQSSFRCELYTQAAARIASGALDGKLAGDTVESLIPAVFDEVLTINGSRFVAPTGLYAIADADGPALAAFQAGTWDGFATTLPALGDALETYVSTAQRATLATERDRRVCATTDPTAPLFDVECP
jgi:hypothetical protein